jgi:hypothetical protein
VAPKWIFGPEGVLATVLKKHLVAEVLKRRGGNMKNLENAK